MRKEYHKIFKKLKNIKKIPLRNYFLKQLRQDDKKSNMLIEWSNIDLKKIWKSKRNLKLYNLKHLVK